MAGDFKQYLDEMKFEKYFETLKKKLKNKKSIIYGTGSLFQYINENFDLSELNIIGISDKKYSLSQEGEEEAGYRVVPKDKMIEYKPDYVIVAAQNYIGIIEDFECNVFDKTKTKIKPLVKMPILTLIKEIWSR